MAKCPSCKSRKLSPVGDKMLRCADCGAEFDRKLAEGQLPGWIVKVVLVVVAAITITFLLTRVIFTSSAAMKPVIYLYAPGEQKERVKLTVKGRITTRIPHRSGLASITWDGLTLSGGKIIDDGKAFDYLFYESENVAPKHGEAGWVLERKAGETTWNGVPVDRGELARTIGSILERYGLFENEIADFTDYWLAPDMKLSFRKEEFAYAIYPISREELDRIFAIETDHEYPERIRVQFLVLDAIPGTLLAEPEFPTVERSERAMHEWGVIRG